MIISQKSEMVGMLKFVSSGIMEKDNTVIYSRKTKYSTLSTFLLAVRFLYKTGSTTEKEKLMPPYFATRL